ncbi:flagellar protein [Mesobacillus maritimus]|uniref:flagellar protein n=1 Tax=Mesobacillus maritimus TaxID=1643336 RepID=UPI00384E00E3
MQSAQLDNCRICGRLFLKQHTDYCLECYKEMELDFDRVKLFLKSEQNRDATVEKVSMCTTVSAKRIAHFIREGRIYAEDFPNLGYPCAYCGKLIKKQILCNSCFDHLSFDISHSLEKEEYVNQILKNQRSSLKESHYWRLKQGK